MAKLIYAFLRGVFKKVETNDVKKTSDSVAALRALSLLEEKQVWRSSDVLAPLFISNKFKFLMKKPLLGSLKRIIEYKYPGSYCHVIARSKHFDKELIAAISRGVKQVVILGAGCDSRVFRFSQELSSAKVFEVDHPATQSQKKKKIEENRSLFPGNVVLVPLDFFASSIADGLMEKGYNCSESTFFMLEGVSMYLSPHVMSRLLSQLYSISKTGNKILFDYAYLSMIEGNEMPYGAKEMLAHGKRKNEPYLFGIKKGGADAYLENFGFKLDYDMSPRDIVDQYLIGDDGKPVGRIHEYIQFCLATAV